MSKSVKIRKGANIKLDGVAEKSTTETSMPSSFAIKPTDFHGLVPKLLLKEGAEVKAGTPIFYDKSDERIKYVSPVSGEIAEIVRGAKRRIIEVRILADKDQKASEKQNLSLDSAEKVKSALLDNGLWPFIKRRPYDIVAKPDETPKSIFISGFDSAPLGVDFNFILQNEKENFQAGVDALGKLTSGKVNLGLRQGESGVLNNIQNAAVNSFSGPHPAGNVGIQIHHVDAIAKGDVVWTVDAQAVALMGRFLRTGEANFSKTIALAGLRSEKA